MDSNRQNLGRTLLHRFDQLVDKKGHDSSHGLSECLYMLVVDVTERLTCYREEAHTMLVTGVAQLHCLLLVCCLFLARVCETDEPVSS